MDSEEVGGDANAMTFEQMADYIREHKVACPACGSTNFTDIRKFNLMFKTFQGVTEDAKNEIFLRPETSLSVGRITGLACVSGTVSDAAVSESEDFVSSA